MILVFKKMKVSGMALWPFILLKDEKLKKNKILLNHERIHHRQQLEMLVIPFYLAYLGHYLINRFKYKDHIQSYYGIAFEREAYLHENDLLYLRKRKWYAWIRFI